MTRDLRWLARISVAVLLFVGAARADQHAQDDPAVFVVLVGSTPCGDCLRQLFKIPEGVESPLRWNLTLRQDPQSHAPKSYELRCDYQIATAALLGSTKKEVTLTKEGSWSLGKGTKSKANAVVFELDGVGALAQVDRNVMQLLNPDRSLMVGTGGWSYTLCRAEAAEKPVDPALALTVPDMSYTISPAASGDNVFGVFEGRTPYQGIARELKTERHEAGTKAKWRVTLFQDANTHEPTTYKVEGTLFRSGAREGNWTITRTTPADPEAVVFELAATKTQAAILLLQGDDNVLFFLDHECKPLVGHADFSYTLNRRSATAVRP